MNRNMQSRKRRPAALQAGRRGPARYSLHSIPLRAAFDTDAHDGEDERTPEELADDLDQLFNEATDFDADAVELAAGVRRIHCDG